MKVKAVKTKPVRHDTELQNVIDQISDFKEGDILAITSKIISVMQGRMVKASDVDKAALIRQEADCYMLEDQYGVMLTIINNILIPTAGIDASNAEGHYILYPENIFQVAEDIRQRLMKKFHVKHCGVIITDSRSAIMRRGVTGFALAWSGFKALRSYVGEKDVFGKPLEFTHVNIPDALSAAAVYEMGEGAECTPMAVISDAKDIPYSDAPVSAQERDFFILRMEDDIYAPLLMAADWTS